MMRAFIDIINNSSADLEGDPDALRVARSILVHMSPMERYRLIDRLPYVRGWNERYRQCVDYIANHMDEFAAK